MNYDPGRIDEAVLALLATFSFDEGRAWKGFDFEVMDRLHERGLIGNPNSKANSVALSAEGLVLGRQCAQRLFAAPMPKRGLPKRPVSTKADDAQAVPAPRRERDARMSYVNTFIEVAPDCRASMGLRPRSRAGHPTAAMLQYELISAEPYVYTHDDVQFHVYAQRLGLSAETLKLDGARLRADYLARSRPSMRTSPLAKIYGWGLHFNAQGHVALVGLGTAEYERLKLDPAINHERAARRKKAG